MSKQEMTVEQALKLAIKEEVKAYDLYIKTSKKVSGAGARAMLKDLAEQEQSHRQLLEDILQKKDVKVLGQNIPAHQNGIGEFLVVSQLRKDASPQEVMIFAIAEEEKAFNFYTALMKHFSGTPLEKLFNKLAAEEQGHKIKLEDEYEAYFMGEN